MSAPNNHQPSNMDVDGSNSARGPTNNASTAGTMDVDSAGPSATSSASSAEEEARRNKEIVKRRILQYFEQLMNGCGRNTCSNPDCASNSAAPKLTKQDAMRRAIELAHQKAELCPPKQQLVPGPATPDTRPTAPVSSPLRQPLAEPPAAEAPVSALELSTLLDAARAASDYTPLIRYVGRVFGDMAAMDKAFPIRTDSGYVLANEVSPAIDYPALDSAFDLLMDEDNKVSNIFAGATSRLIDSLGFQNVSGPLTDYTPLRKFMILLENPHFEDPDSYPNFKKLLKAVSKLPAGHQKALTGWYSRYSPIRLRRVASRIQTYITVRWAMGNVFDTDIAPAVQTLACLYEASEHPGYDRLALHPGDSPQQCERPHLFHPITPSSASLASADRSPSPPGLAPPNPSLLSFIQATPSAAPAASQVMFAPFGVMPSSSGSSSSTAAPSSVSAVSAMDADAETKREASHLISVSSKSVKKIDYSALRAIDGGEVKLTGGRAMIPFEFFYNDAVNSEQDFKEDYKKWRDPRGKFSFCAYPFILDPASKSRILQVDAHYQMVAQFEEAMQTFLFTRQSPYLVLQVRRDNLIEDTLQQLQHVAKSDLKKPLKVKFVGEEGIDEGGVQKEFFQLVVKELFSPDLGYDMFVYDQETYSFWFNKDTMTTNMEFELIGMILGLAIYNSVILDVHLPLVAYKKLMKENVGFEDLEAMSPSTARGLRQLLEFDGDVESTYCRTFSVQYEVFGSMKTVDLKPNGSSIPLTNANRAEYVDLYIDWFLNKSVEKQFNAFAHGFDLVAGGDALKLFRSEELELLVCGSPVLDFEALERVTQYEDGFTKSSRTIRHFWQVVHRMSLEEKKKLLFFCTGSDRVPIKGLSNLSFTISKNGPDSERLPTAHTCFNHLLLPDYSSAEKLERFLKLAIENSQGFGLR